MSDERLKEIKDSIDLQLEVIKQLNIDNELVPEEKELYDYAESLKERVSYLEKSIVRKEETIAELEQERVPYTNKYVDKVDKENQELKKQLEEANKKLYLCTPEISQNIHGKYVSYVDLVNEMYELKKQQKEFINYLEDEIQSCEAVSDLLFNFNKEMKVYKKISQKYKEIIGEDINGIN